MKPSREQLQALGVEHGSWAGVARVLGLHKATVARWARAYGLSSESKFAQRHEANTGRPSGFPLGQPSVSIQDGTATIVTLTRASGESVSPEEVLTEHGLDPELWEVVSYTSNRWHGAVADGGKQLLEQSKLTARRKAETLLPVVKLEPGWSPPKPTPRRAQAGRPLLKLILADPHAPLQEQDMEAGIVAWIREHQPDEIWMIGDAADNSPWGRHKPNRRIKVSADEAMQAQYDYFAQLRAAAPDARIVVIWGNHDYWVYDRIMETMPQLGRLKSPHTGKPVIDLGAWLGFDDLHIEVVAADGEYHDGTAQVMPDLVGMHGNTSGPYGGAVKEFTNWEGASVLQGHDHKAALVLISKRLADGTEVQRVAMSVGSGARRDLGYDPRRNVCQAFGTITAHADGQWHPELGIFNPQTRTLTWRGWVHMAG